MMSPAAMFHNHRKYRNDTGLKILVVDSGFRGHQSFQMQKSFPCLTNVLLHRSIGREIS